MNKRELIKALFKNPTIKALYESGQFNAADINRAILTEASDIEESVKNFPVASRPSFAYNCRQGISRAFNKAKKERNFDAFLKTYADKIPYEKWDQISDDDKVTLTNYVKYIKETLIPEQIQIFQAEEAAKSTETTEDDKAAAAAQQKVDAAAETAINNTDQKLQGSEGEVSDVDETLKPYLAKYQQIIGNKLDSIMIEETDDNEDVKLKKSFIIFFLEKKVELDDSIDGDKQDSTFEGLAKLFAAKFDEGGTYAQEFANYFEGKKVEILEFLKTNESLEKFKSLSTSQGADQQDTETSESSVDPEVIAKLEKLLNEANPNLLPIVNKYPKFKELLAVEYVKALKEKPEDTATTPETSTPETSTATPSPQPATPASDTGGEVAGAMEESINRALSGIFLIENTDEDKTSPASTEGGTEDTKADTSTGQPVDADEVPKMLEVLKQLFINKNLAIDVDEIWKLSQQKEEPEDKRDAGEDVSPPDIAEFNENWTEVLMTFFGKNPNRSSFMKRLLLKSQAKMLYDVIDVLEQVTNSSEMSSLTDMNLDDEKEKRADKAQLQEVFPFSSDSTALELDTSPEGIAKSKGKPADEVEPEEVQPEPEQSQPEPQVQQDKVELPPKTRRIIKQDLQSMVDLLKQLKLAIKDYSINATRKSADPRFDGSKLKANMDGLLAQVQEDIYDLHSNLKPVDLAPEQEDENIEEALSGIILEEDDPERQAKIQLVRETYDNAKEEYIYVLMPSMEEGVWNKSQTSAKKILDILKKEEFISLFPTALKTSGGRVMTLGDAYKSMTALIQEFVETVRDIVLISKKKYISNTSLTQAKNKLEKISLEIAELFRVPSKFSEEEIKQAKEEEAKDPTKQAITDQPENNLEQGQEDHSPGTTTDEDSGTVADEDGETEEPPADEDGAPAGDTGAEPETSQEKFETFSKKNKLIGELAEIISQEDWNNDDEKLEALMAAQSYMSTYVEEQVIKNPELTDEQKEDIRKYLKDNIIGDTKNEGLIKESEDDKSTRRPDGSDPTEEPHPTDYGLSFLTLLGEKEQKILRSKTGLVKKLAKFIDENFKNLIKDYSDEQYLAKISVPVETKMKDLDLKNFDGKKEIQNFWTFVADLFGKLNLEEDIQYFEEASNKKYGKFSTNARALIKKLDDPYKTADALKYDDVNNLEREMKSFLEFILKNKLSVDQSKLEQDSALKNRFVFIVDSFGKNLRHESNKVSLTKQLAPFMRFTRRLKKNTRRGQWYRSSFLSDITKEFERIIDEKNLVNYIEKSNHNPQPSSFDPFEESLEKALKPIIETMLKEHYNY